MEDILAENGDINQGIRHFSAREAFDSLQKGAVLVDIREEYHTAMKTFLVENYIVLPLSLFDENIMNLPTDHLLIIADATGLHSKTAAGKLLQKGFTQVANLAGGIIDWERDGFPVNKDPSQQLSGQCPCMLRPKLSNRNL
jgi:rhodanese-related sulfurtransferase